MCGNLTVKSICSTLATSNQGTYIKYTRTNRLELHILVGMQILCIPFAVSTFEHTPNGRYIDATHTHWTVNEFLTSLIWFSFYFRFLFALVRRHSWKKAVHRACVLHWGMHLKLGIWGPNPSDECHPMSLFTKGTCKSAKKGHLRALFGCEAHTTSLILAAQL